ncbi:hypothetical protein D9M72_119250 [compost metagenome]
MVDGRRGRTRGAAHENVTRDNPKHELVAEGRLDRHLAGVFAHLLFVPFVAAKVDVRHEIGLVLATEVDSHPGPGRRTDDEHLFGDAVNAGVLDVALQVAVVGRRRGGRREVRVRVVFQRGDVALIVVGPADRPDAEGLACAVRLTEHPLGVDLRRGRQRGRKGQLSERLVSLAGGVDHQARFDRVGVPQLDRHADGDALDGRENDAVRVALLDRGVHLQVLASDLDPAHVHAAREARHKDTGALNERDRAGEALHSAHVHQHRIHVVRAHLHRAVQHHLPYRRASLQSPCKRPLRHVVLDQHHVAHGTCDGLERRTELYRLQQQAVLVQQNVCVSPDFFGRGETGEGHLRGLRTLAHRQGVDHPHDLLAVAVVLVDPCDLELVGAVGRAQPALLESALDHVRNREHHPRRLLPLDGDAETRANVGAPGMAGAEHRLRRVPDVRLGVEDAVELETVGGAVRRPLLPALHIEAGHGLRAAIALVRQCIERDPGGVVRRLVQPLARRGVPAPDHSTTIEVGDGGEAVQLVGHPNADAKQSGVAVGDLLELDLVVVRPVDVVHPDHAARRSAASTRRWTVTTNADLVLRFRQRWREERAAQRGLLVATDHHLIRAERLPLRGADLANLREHGAVERVVRRLGLPAAVHARRAGEVEADLVHLGLGHLGDERGGQLLADRARHDLLREPWDRRVVGQAQASFDLVVAVVRDRRVIDLDVADARDRTFPAVVEQVQELAVVVIGDVRIDEVAPIAVRAVGHRNDDAFSRNVLGSVDAVGRGVRRRGAARGSLRLGRGQQGVDDHAAGHHDAGVRERVADRTDRCTRKSSREAACAASEECQRDDCDDAKDALAAALFPAAGHHRAHDDHIAGLRVRQGLGLVFDDLAVQAEDEFAAHDHAREQVCEGLARAVVERVVLPSSVGLEWVQDLDDLNLVFVVGHSCPRNS